MTAADILIVQRKLSVITEALSLLEPIADMPLTEYLGKVYERKAAERILQTLIDAAVDINTHLLVDAGFPPPADYYSSFVDVARKLGVLDIKLATSLAPSAGLRNRLIHEYDNIDDAIVHASMKVALKLYPDYVDAVLHFVEHPASS